MIFPRFLLASLLSVFLSLPLLHATHHSTTGSTGAVAGGSAASVEAALGILQRGGNAADAAVAALLVQSGVEWKVFCFGGEAVILAHRAEGNSTEVIGGVGEAPALATREHFAGRGGIPGSNSPQTAAVPSAFGAFLTLLERHGTMSFADVAAPFAKVLEQNSASWSPAMARTLLRLIEAEKGAANRKAGLKQVADYFYRGEIAREIDAWSRANHGLLRFEDFAAHRTIVEAPLSIEYRDRTILKPGAWSQGPVLLQTLRLLEGKKLRDLDPKKADYIHQVAEALKLALADRDAYYGDPAFVSVPMPALLSEEYSMARRRLITATASMIWSPGQPRADLVVPVIPTKVFQPKGKASDTTTCIVVDRHRNVVVATPSGWGGVVAGDTGVVLGSRLRSFNTWEGHPNCVAPGKRPRITLSPTLVLTAGKPTLAISVAGGDWQDQAALQILLNSLEFDLPPTEAVSRPRWGTRHHLSSFDEKPIVPANLLLPPEIEAALAEELRGRGHVIERKKELVGLPVVVRLDPATGAIEVASDPKEKRHVAAY